ncbi:MAG: Ig-like domain-containing protein, partial [Clostridia bacterium]|nr:Ig-like domain-containing protein [Clostridia bacterium]
LPSVSAIGAGANEGIYYENYFDNADAMSIFSGDGSTFSVENGLGKIETPMKANELSYVYASLGKDNPLHKISDGEKDTLEVKVKFERPTQNYLFGPYDTSGKAEKNYYALLKYNNTEGTSLKGSDEKNFSSDFNMKYNEWRQLYFVFDNDKYYLYIDGKKATGPINLKAKGNTDTLTQIDKFMFAGKKESAVTQVTWIDDIIAQKLAPIYLSKSSIANGAENVSAETAKTLVLDFNTIVDASSLGNINITAGDRSLSDAEYDVSVDKGDATKVIIKFNCDLSSATQYTVNYTGIKDVINSDGANTASGTLSFTTEEKEIPLKVTSEKQITDVSVFAPVTVVFNKVVSEESLNGIHISPSAEIETEAVDNTVIIKPKYNWIANKNYTVSFDALTALDGSTVDSAASSIEFSTVADPYASAAISGDVSWYNGFVVNAEKAKKTGICGISYNVIQPIDKLAGKKDLPFLYKASLGTTVDDTLEGPMLCLLSNNQSKAAIVYELKNGLGKFTLHTGEKIDANGKAGILSFYTAKDGANFTDDSAYTEVSYIKSGEPSDKWQTFTYTVTASDPTIRYLKVVISKPDGVKTIFTPALMGAEAQPYKPVNVTVLKAENTDSKTVDIMFDGFLDFSSISNNKFAVSENSVLNAEVISDKNSYCPTVRLTLNNELDNQKIYNITVSGLVDIFGNPVSDISKKFSANNSFAVIDAGFDATAKKITGTVLLPQDNKYIGKTANIIIACYDSEKALKKCFIEPVVLKQGENTFEISADISALGNAIKAMLWLNENMAPICAPGDVKTAS